MSATDEQRRARRLWVEALRSGDYKQTKGWLADEKGFCCLGVLCEVAKREGVTSDYPDDLGTLFMVPGIQGWVGLAGDVGRFGVGADASSLIALNDHLGYTFAQIADVIESEPEGLFVS